MSSNNSKDRAREALTAANQLATLGRFQEALEKHIWFHNHALEVDEAYYGVRLSYALAYWVELGRKYPPALNALKEIRNDKSGRLLAGELDRDLFHDVVAINHRLGDQAATAELFKRIDARDPEFATSVYDLADEALIATGEFSLAKKHLRDPLWRFEIAKRNFDEGMEYSDPHRPREQAHRRAMEAIFADDVLRILIVLDKTGDRTSARDLQRKALAVLPSDEIRNALAD